MKKFTFTIGTEYSASGSAIYWSNEEERRYGVAEVLKRNGAEGWTILPTSGGWWDNCGCSLVEEQGLRVEVVGTFAEEWGEGVALQLAEYYQQSCVLWEVCEVRAAFASPSSVEVVDDLRDAINRGAGAFVRLASTGTMYRVEWACGSSARLRNLDNGRTVGVNR